MTHSPSEPAAHGLPAPDRRDLVLVLLLVAGGLALRWSHVDRGFTSDEVSLLFRGDLERLMRSNLTAVNPPGHRLLLAWLGGDLGALRLGRLLSLVSGLLALPAVYLTARHLAASRLVALATGALVATSAVAVETSVMTRSYAPWLALATWHLWGTTHWLEPGGVSRRRSGTVVAVTALLLPQVHYFSVPLLAVEGLLLAVVSRRRIATLALYLPAAAGFGVWVGPILSGTRHRLAPDHGGWLRALERATDLQGSLAPTVLLLMLLAGLRLGRQGQKAICAGMLGVLFGCWFLGRQHYFTPHTLAFSLAFLPALAASSLGWTPLQTRGHPARAVFAVALLLLSLRWGLDQARHVRSDLEPVLGQQGRDFTARFADHWTEWLPEDTAVDVIISPRFVMQCLLLYETGMLLGEVRGEPRCEGERRCFVSRGQRFIGRPFGELPRDREILVVHANRFLPEGLPEGCSWWEPAPDVVPMYRCAALQPQPTDPGNLPPG